MYEPKSILIVCNSLITGGAEKQTVMLANGLHKKGWKVVMVYLSPSHDLLSEVDEGLKKTVFYVARTSYIDLKAIVTIRKIINTYSISSILCVNQLSLLYSVVSRGFNKKLKLYAGFHTTKLRTQEAIKFYLSSWWLFKCTSKVIYVCNIQMKYWQQRSLHRKNAGIYIHNGVDTNEFVVATPDNALVCRRLLNIPENALLLVSIAMLRSEKRHIDMLSVLKKISDNGVDGYLLCVGDGPEREKISEKANELNISHRIKMIGRVENVKPYLSSSDAMLMLSNAIETFSIAVLESLSCGCPVVAYNIGGIQEQIKKPEHGKIIKQGDEDEIVKKLMQIQKEKEYLDKVTLHEYINSHFSLEVMISNYEKVLA